MSTQMNQGSQVTNGDCIDNPPAPPIQGIEDGMKIGNFLLEKMLGRGGMGEVWLAYQESMDRHVAIKLLSPAFVQDENFVKRFLKEAKLSGKMEHPNIITAHDAGIENGIYYLAMSFVDGEDLSDVIRRDRYMQEKPALEVGKKIAEALKYAWDNYKILHRDIKPSNIMLDANGSPKLMDMGISKAINEEASMTMTGAIVGTPHYISPEQARGESDMDFRADIYSLGATLYNILTGDVPFKSMTTLGVLSKLISEPLPPPKVMNPQLTDGCAMLIEIMMAKDRNQRQASWQEVIDDIEAVLDGGIPHTQLPEDAREHYQNVTGMYMAQKRKAEASPMMSKHVLIALVASILVVSVAVVALAIAIKNKNKKKPPTITTVNTGTEPIKTPPANNQTTIEQTPEANSGNDTPVAKQDPVKPTNDNKPETTSSQDQVTTVPKEIPKKPIEVAVVTPTVIDAQEQKAKEQYEYAAQAFKDSLAKQDDFELAIKLFSNIKNNFKTTTYAQMAESEINKLKEAEKRAIADVEAQLMKKAQEYIKKKDFVKAASIFNDYDLKLASKTRSFRVENADACLLAPRKYKTLSDFIYQQITQFSLLQKVELPTQAQKDLHELAQFYPNEIGDIKKNLESLNAVSQQVKAYFRDRINKDVTVQITEQKKPKTVTLHVEKFIKDDISGKTKSGNDITFSLSEIHPDELKKMCKDIDLKSMNMIMGLLAFKQQDFDQCDKYFSNAGIFSDRLAELKTATREREAARLYKMTLVKAGLSIKTIDKDEVIRSLGEKQLQKPQAHILLAGVKELNAKYNDTDVVKNSRKELDLIKSVSEAVIKRVNLLGPDAENVGQNITNATADAINTLLGDDDDEPKKKDK